MYVHYIMVQILQIKLQNKTYHTHPRLSFSTADEEYEAHLIGCPFLSQSSEIWIPFFLKQSIDFYRCEISYPLIGKSVVWGTGAF